MFIHRDEETDHFEVSNIPQRREVMPNEGMKREDARITVLDYSSMFMQVTVKKRKRILHNGK